MSRSDEIYFINRSARYFPRCSRMPGEFDKYWNDTKKHQKRLDYWLLHAKELSSQLGGRRAFRYFTLCARSVIDVFMLAKERVLNYDADLGIVTHVGFCEYDF